MRATVLFAIVLLAIPFARADTLVDTSKGETLRENSLTVSVVSVEAMSSREAMRFREWVEVRIRFSNSKDGGIVRLLDSWSGRLSEAEAVDDQGGGLGRLHVGFRSPRNAPVEPPTLYPGRSAEAVLNFEKPPATTKHFVIEMPGPEGKEVLRFKVESPKK